MKLWEIDSRVQEAQKGSQLPLDNKNIPGFNKSAVSLDSPQGSKVVQLARSFYSFFFYATQMPPFIPTQLSENQKSDMFQVILWWECVVNSFSMTMLSYGLL